MIGNYKTVYLLGVTCWHEPSFRKAEVELTKRGYIVLAPAVYDYVIYDYENYLTCKDSLKDICYEKLKSSDFCVLVTPEHVELSISLRIRQAIEMKKPVYIWDRKNNNFGTTIDNEKMLQILIDSSIPA